LLDGYRLEALAPERHRRTLFRCGVSELDDFIQKFAKNQDRNDTTRLHVYAEAQGLIAGYFTLSALTLELSGLPDSLRKGRPRLPVPATLLGRLAVDRQFKGKGLGALLLSLALREAYRASRIVASAMVVVDARADAVEFYKRAAAFQSLPSNSLRLVLAMQEISDSIRD
jgi:GNAT superfamily N-acetyltransferase